MKLFDVIFTRQTLLSSIILKSVAEQIKLAA